MTTPPPKGYPRLPVEVFEEQAARTPHRVAVICDGTRTTYGQLNARANRLACLLRDEGAGRERIVALALSRSAELIGAVLTGHPDVSQAVVAARTFPGGAAGSRLVGYLVPRTTGRDGDRGPDTAAIRAYLGDRLPDYMVPSALVVLDSLPLTPNGKIDRAALPAPG